MTAWQRALAWCDRVNQSKRVNDWTWEAGGWFKLLLIALLGITLGHTVGLYHDYMWDIWERTDRIERAQAQATADMKARLDQIHEELRERK